MYTTLQVLRCKNANYDSHLNIVNKFFDKFGFNINSSQFKHTFAIILNDLVVLVSLQIFKIRKKLKRRINQPT